MSSERAAATRRIAADAHTIFAIVSNPAGHVDVDGSGMLERATDARPVTAVGETFDMDMDRAPLGDIPEMGKYKVRNTVTQIVPDRLFEWGVGAVDTPMFGHVYGWQIDPVSDTECDVTNYCDWTNISQEMRSRREWPIIPLQMLERSVEKLEQLVTKG
jgi:hypothetical protein